MSQDYINNFPGMSSLDRAVQETEQCMLDPVCPPAKLFGLADLQSLLDGLLAEHVPEYVVTWIVGDDPLVAHTLSFGPGSPCLWIPKPATPDLFFICLHELNHAMNKDMGPLFIDAHDIERRASNWARDYMAEHNIPLSPSCWARAVQNYETHETNWDFAKSINCLLLPTDSDIVIELKQMTTLLLAGSR